MTADAAPKTIPQLIDGTATRFPQHTALQIKREGRWQKLTFAEVHEQAHRVAAALAARGIGKGAFVGILAENSPEWPIAYFGVSIAGATAVPVDHQLTPTQVGGLYAQTPPALVFATAATADRLAEVKTEQVVWLQPPEEEVPAPPAPAMLFSELVAEGRAHPAPQVDVGPDDVASILFTSGTTGAAKGVMLTHGGFTSTFSGFLSVLPLDPGAENGLLVLPLYHVAAFTIFMAGMQSGASVTFVPTLRSDDIMEALKETAVTIFPGVPQLYDLFAQGLRSKIGKLPLPVRLIFAGLQTVSNASLALTGKSPGKRLFGKIHREFGGHIKFMVNGGSRLDPRVQAFFRTLGFTIVDTYGLTETHNGITSCTLQDPRSGSVGKPLPHCEMRIFEPNDEGIGEVILRGPSATPGYFGERRSGTDRRAGSAPPPGVERRSAERRKGDWRDEAPEPADEPPAEFFEKNEEATAALLRDGWLHTGDLGYFDKDGFLFLTGRKNDLIVLASGKNVYPDEIEQQLAQSPLFGEVCVLGCTLDDSGSSREIVHAVVVPDEAQQKARSREELDQACRDEVRRLCAGLPSYKRVQSVDVWFEPLPRTTTRKVQRNVVRERCGARA